MKIFKRILAVLFWLGAVGLCICIFVVGFNIINNIDGILRMLPMQFAMILLFYRWGKDLWFTDPGSIYMNNWVRSLIYIGYHVGLFFVCALLGITISVFVADGNPFVTNLIFFLTILFVGLCIHPKMYIPKHILIPNSVTKIESYAFGRRSSIVTVTIGHNIISIGKNPFYGCRKLKAFYGKFTSSDSRCLIVNGVLKAFAPAGLAEYSIPDYVTAIGDKAFYACNKLKSVIIPDSVTGIGNYAFSGCTSLINAAIPDNVAFVGMGAFWGCKNLTSVTIPNSVSDIGSYTFYNCTSVTRVTIGNRVTSIGERAFGGCSLLKEIYCKPITPPIAYSYMFQGIALNGKIYVPRNSVDAYKSAEGWKDYAGIIVGYDF